MPGATKNLTKVFLRPHALSVLGVALVAPIPILAANPALMPAWFLVRAGGVPVLTWILLLVMAALVGVAVLSIVAIGAED